jgi:AAA domain
MEKDEQIAPGIVFVRDVVDIALRLPVRFANTLLGVAEAYHLDTMKPRKIDSYYREPLGNAIPRERIFEIWNCPTGVIRMYGRPVSLADATKQYGDVLRNHAWALASVTARLRADLRDCLQGNAPRLDLSNPSGATKVAYDSRLWIQWDEVEAKTDKTEGNLNLIAKAERLEASYKAIVLPKMLKDLGGHRYEFEVSEESTEAKLEEGGGYYVLAFANDPSFTLKTGASLGIAASPPDLSYPAVRNPLHKVISVTLESFDRANRKAVIALRARWPGVRGVFDELFRRGLVPLKSEPIFILEGLPYDDSRTTAAILREVGNPPCAKPAPEALLALGKTKTKTPKGTDPVTPIARVLWEADALGAKAVRSDADADQIAAHAQSIKPLNTSQVDAVRECVKHRLSIIWGPPGTGKTDTLVAMLHALVAEAQKNPRSRKILITGPNYRAVEELSERLLASLDGDSACPADFFWVYSRSRPPKALPDTKPHLHAAATQPGAGDHESENLRASLLDPAKITLVATTAHVIKDVTMLLFGKDHGLVQAIFNLIVIDESSQVPVTLAMRPLSTLKDSGQIVVAGDHLQMPPIASLDPPMGAEYLVGSIQTYLLKRFGVPRRELLINYRSNQHLVDYAKTLGYPPRLAAQHPLRRLESIADLDKVIASMPGNLPKSALYKEILDPERRVTAFIHDDIVSSQANEIEAKLVASLAYCLRHSMSRVLYPKAGDEKYEPFTDDDLFKFGLGVVTPHKAQKALVLKELMVLFPKASPEMVLESVDTVERFQGSERQTIIVSFGVGDTDIIEGEEAFLLQMERTNVAVSRAKAKCIVLMPKALAYHLPTDPKAVTTSKAVKSYIEEFCASRLSTEIEYAGKKRSAEVRWH